VSCKKRNYLRRDFAFAVAMTAKGEATVIRASAKTNAKLNMLFLAFFGFDVKLDKDDASQDR
jgi:hypothetical protein